MCSNHLCLTVSLRYDKIIRTNVSDLVCINGHYHSIVCSIVYFCMAVISLVLQDLVWDQKCARYANDRLVAQNALGLFICILKIHMFLSSFFSDSSKALRACATTQNTLVGVKIRIENIIMLCCLFCMCVVTRQKRFVVIRESVDAVDSTIASEVSTLMSKSIDIFQQISYREGIVSILSLFVQYPCKSCHAVSVIYVWLQFLMPFLKGFTSNFACSFSFAPLKQRCE